MAEMPISSVDAASEIKSLIIEKGIQALTSKIIRRHLEAKFNCSLSNYKTEIDNITVQQIEEVNGKKLRQEDYDYEKSVSKESSSSDTDNIVDDLVCYLFLKILFFTF